MSGNLRKNRKVLIWVICIITFCGLFFYNNHKKQYPKTIEDAVSTAIKSKSSSYFGAETSTEGHIILKTEEKSGRLKVYTLSSFGAFGFENGIFTKVSGSGSIPTVMTFSRDSSGKYSLIEYKEPIDGTGLDSSIKSMFPFTLWHKALNAENYYGDLIKQQELQAKEYLSSIGRTAEVSEKPIETKLPNINVIASNKIFSELAKNNSFINDCPSWIGSRERIENGIRYVYETAQSKTSDGYDLIVFKKIKSGSIVKECKYKIVGSEPQLIR